MKKTIFSLFCVLAFLLSLSVSALEGEGKRAADTLYTLGLLDDTNYALTVPADRVSAVSLLVRLSGENVVGAGQTTLFQDVPGWAADAVFFAARQGWVAGVSANTFAPEQAITANAWFTMLLRMLGYRDSAGDFSVSEAAVFARRIGLTSRSYPASLNRGDLMEAAREALLCSYQDGSGTVISKLVARGVCDAAVVNALGLNTQELTARQAADRHMAANFCLSLFESQEDITKGEATADASGFFITSDGIAVTCYHSIDGAIHANATLTTGESYPVERVLWYDADMDLAVIRISRTSTEGKTTSAFAFLEIAGTKEIRDGDVVYALSNPLGLGLAVSSGIISATSREVERYTLPCVLNTAAISQGSSGGALLNVYGRVVAVTSGAFRNGNNMFLGIPADILPTININVPGKTLEEVTQYEQELAERELAEQDEAVTAA